MVDAKKSRVKWTLSTDDSVLPRGVRTLTAAEVGVVFQPIVDVFTGTTFAYEALVRCRRPEYAAPPVLFERAVAEGACGKLGRVIRDVAFATCGDVALFVNLHPDELSARWLVQPDDPIGFHTRDVYIELTESASLSHFDLCRDIIAELAGRTGARLVIDDFGAGYSNLERMVDLEPAVVKLDLALTRGVHLHPRKQAVVRHVVNLCKELGASVVAEGVETLDELKAVRDLGVTYAQGYLLARPAAPPPVASWPLETRPIEARPRGPRPPPLAAPLATPLPARKPTPTESKRPGSRSNRPSMSAGKPSARPPKVSVRPTRPAPRPKG
jgi:EAL domain-containing protein (putative c-di-GMP-specific phosphodiesterase class I)